MIVIERAAPGASSKQIIVLFGFGLIGRSIVAALNRERNATPIGFPFTWGEKEAWPRELNVVEQHILLHGRPPNQGPAITRIDTIWAAGRSGFTASEPQAAAELAVFDQALSLGARLQNAIPGAHHAFHLLSSAGGLYNGQRNVDGASAPRATNPYGHAKIEEERRLRVGLAQAQQLIYRPSSVYGFSGFGTRIGLITALIQNSIRHQTSRIFGSPHTIRDYVLSADVGRFIGDRLDNPDRCSGTFILASGKPTTIFEVLHKVGRVVGRHVYHKFESSSSNASDMSFRRSILPPSWRPTDIETGIRQTARQLMDTYVLSRRSQRP